MPRYQFTKQINASPETVWNVMLGQTTYPEWTKPFNPTSNFEGKWETGSKILFVGTGADGEVGGMVSRIAEARPFAFVGIEHLGFVRNGVEITEGPEVSPWAGSRENYTFTKKDGGTELTVDIDLPESEYAQMGGMWKEALDVLKGMAEAR